VLRIRIRIQDPVPFCPLDLGSGMGKKSRSGSRIRIRDEHHRSYFRVLRNFLGYKYLNSLMRIRIQHPESLTLDPGSGMDKFGSGINIWKLEGAVLIELQVGVGLTC
jgi:hypothetical protein